MDAESLEWKVIYPASAVATVITLSPSCRWDGITSHHQVLNTVINRVLVDEELQVWPVGREQKEAQSILMVEEN